MKRRTLFAAVLGLLGRPLASRAATPLPVVTTSAELAEKIASNKVFRVAPGIYTVQLVWKKD